MVTIVAFVMWEDIVKGHNIVPIVCLNPEMQQESNSE